ncbi:MAG: MATE family efflux transporter [Oscillospiraceae bacterium]|nr:MATE family efflux transporter [Oscillospiraceae bacterium]
MVQNKITQGSIPKQLLAFFFPIWVGTFFQQLYNTVDAVIVGNFVGKEALAAVGGPTGTIINLMVGFFVGMSSGAGVVIAQYYGARREDETSKAVHTAMALALWGGVMLTVCGLVFSPTLLRSMGTPESVMQHATAYIRIYFAGTVFNLIYNIGSGILRAVGDSKRPLYFLMICSGCNVVLDILFVAVLQMGVTGAALATILSQAVSAGLVLLSLTNVESVYRLHLSKIKLDFCILGRIIHIGLPAGLQSVMYSVSNIVIQASINGFGLDTVAAWTAYGKIDGLFWMTISSFGTAITIFVGQNFGAGFYDRVKKSVRICFVMSAAVTVVLSSALLLGGPYLYRLFTDDEKVIALGIEIMRFLVPYYFTYVAIDILSGAMRGAGDGIVPMIITCIGVCVLRVIWISFAVPMWPTLKTACFSYPLTWSITSVAFVVYYIQGSWLRRHIPPVQETVQKEESLAK